MPLTADDGRRNAAAEDAPTLLLGPDMIHYAELLENLGMAPQDVPAALAAAEQQAAREDATALWWR